MENAEDVIAGIRGVTFDWGAKMTGREGQPAVGVIAQEVLAKAPLVVSHDTATDYYAVDYTRLVPYLVEAVKSLKRRCDGLEEELVAVKRQCTECPPPPPTA